MSQPILYCNFLVLNEDTNYCGTRLTQQCNTGGETRLKWTCFNNRVRKGVEEEVAFQLSGWEMQAEKNYNSDTHCVRGLTKTKVKCQ